MRMANISIQLVRPLGFSKGWAELALSGPPPFVPSSLMISCEAKGPRAMICSAPCSVVAVAVPSNVWVTPCQDEHDGADHGEGQQDVERRARQVDPEVADRRGVAPDEATDEGHGDGDAGGGRREVAHRQAGRLDEVAGALARVVLPVRVGLEADGRVEGQLGREGRAGVRVQRQDVLEPQHGVHDEDAHEAEQQQRHRSSPSSPARTPRRCRRRGRRHVRRAAGPGSGTVRSPSMTAAM